MNRRSGNCRPQDSPSFTDRATDFWRETHYGFTRHSGHFFGHTTSGGFTASLRVRGRYESLYDQAGLMVLVDDEHWIKAGVELSDGEAMLSSVLTAGQSDWATGAFPGDPSDFWMRATVDTLLRLRYPRMDAAGRSSVCARSRGRRTMSSVRCAARRSGQGLSVLFSDFTVGLPDKKTFTTLRNRPGTLDHYALAEFPRQFHRSLRRLQPPKRCRARTMIRRIWAGRAYEWRHG